MRQFASRKAKCILTTRMKFWHRCLILGSTIFLMGTLYYYMLLDGSLEASHDRRRALESHLSSSHLKSLFKSFSMVMDPEVCGMGPHRQAHSHGNISTLDVFHEASFSVQVDGMYELASPQPDHPKKEELDDLEHLQVIIMPHSHVDPGWLKTTNEYYTDKTKHILTNMVNKLTEHPDMTFVWAETIYFAMWWNELEDAVKVHVRRLVRRGQLEIALGGWVMPDEASTHYVSLIDQLVEGHQWLWENLHVTPTNSWSIDPFGYSGTAPYLWKLAGMENMVIQRVHQSVKASLISKKSMEFWWRQFWDTRGDTAILCHIMPYLIYSIKFSCGPNRFICLLFDFRSIPGDVSDTRAHDITENNVEKFAEYMYKQFRQKALIYKYNTILVPLGDDFRFEHELEWDQQYGNYSKLMEYMNNRKDWKVSVRFGTLKDYFRLTRQEQLEKKYSGKDTDFPVLSGDFFPYSDRNLEYWTGYYSTRPFDKRFQREVQGMIQAADMALTFTFALYKRWGLEMQEKFFHFSSLMQTAHRAQGQFLHHDAITGTSKDFVVVDFEEQLLAAYNSSQSVMKMALQLMVTRGKVEKPYVFQPETVRRRYNEPPRKIILSVTSGGTHIFIFNPLPHYRQQPVHILVNKEKFTIKDQMRNIVPCQINPVWDDEDSTTVQGNVFEVVFIADLPPLATVPYMLFEEDNLPKTSNPARLSVFNEETLVVPPDTHFFQNRPENKATQAIVIENQQLRVRLAPDTGVLLDVEDRNTGKITKLNIELNEYTSQGSGAYLFFPSSGAVPLIKNIPLVRVVSGPLVTQVTVVYEPYIHQTFSLYHHPTLLASSLHIRNDLNIQTLKNREVIMRIQTDLHLKKPEFFSDQNGFQFMRRRTNPNNRIEANYYPMTTGAFLDDGIRRLTLISAQPHGVAGLEPGWLEVMLDRQLMHDDDRGLGQGVEDVKPVTSEFVLLVEKRLQPSTPSQAHYGFPSLSSIAISDRLQQPPQIFYSLIEADIFFASIIPTQVALPCDVSLLSLRSLATSNLLYNGTSLILHRRAYDCDFPGHGLQCSVSGQPVTFKAFFSELGLNPQEIRETSLTHLHHKRSWSPKDPLTLSPVQIGAYHLWF